MSILDSFEVIEVPRTFSIAEVRILKNKISFNLPAASELGYPAFVRVFISRDKTQIALQPCDKITPNAMKFFTEDVHTKQRKTIGVGNRALATLIKAGMQWDMAQARCAPGVRFAEENVIIFDLKQAYIRGQKPTEERGLCVRPQPAYPFMALPSEYFSGDDQVIQQVIINGEGERLSA